MLDEVAEAVGAIEDGFKTLRSIIERRAFEELEPCLCRQTKLFQFLPARDPVVQELAQRGHQLVLWALDNVRQHRCECAKTLAESKKELQLLQSYDAAHLAGELSMPR